MMRSHVCPDKNVFQACKRCSREHSIITNYRSFFKQRADSNMESELEGMRLETVNRSPKPLRVFGVGSAVQKVELMDLWLLLDGIERQGKET